MVFNNQNYLVSELCPLSLIINVRKHNVLETGSVSVLRGRRETTALFGPLERVNLTHWTSFHP
jgi:hypothetical protein